MADPDVSVLVVGMNNLQYLQDCFSSILSQKGANFEVIYIDNLSSDGSADFVEKNFPQVSVVKSPSNTGYAGGNNLGAKNANGKYVLIVNPDTIVKGGWLSSLFSFLEEKAAHGQDAIACSKVLLASKPDEINSIGVFVSSLGFSGSIADGRREKDFTSSLEVFAPTGCSFMMNRRLFLSMGGFDGSLFMYEDDSDLGWRAANRGIKSYCVPSSVVLHKYKKFKGRPFPYYHTLRNHIIIVRKNEKGLKMAALVLTSAAFALVFSFANLLLLRPQIFMAGISGIKDGFSRKVIGDQYAGGPGGRAILGVLPTISIAAGKFTKHFF